MLGNESSVFVGAASCRDQLSVAAGCRSYNITPSMVNPIHGVVEVIKKKS
jgi:hypothetical protein